MPTQSDYILSRMKLLPRDTVRIKGSVRDHKVLHVRVRKDDYPVLQTVASEEWLQYMHEDVTVLVSTTDTHDHLSVEMYEDMVLTLPLSKTKAKMLKTKNVSERELAMADFITEVELLCQLRHPNICLLLGYCMTTGHEIMVSELMKCSLHDVFKTLSQVGKTMSLKRATSYATILSHS